MSLIIDGKANLRVFFGGGTRVVAGAALTATTKAINGSGSNQFTVRLRF